MLWLGAVAAQAQAPAPKTMPFGKIDKADLTMTSCDFEKDANAMVLFEKGDVYYDQELSIVVDHHKRIKIFNENGKKEANIRIEFISGGRYEYISNLQAETINLNDKGDVEITKLDKKVLYTEAVDKNTSAMVFSFPNVKPGSIIEYKYSVNRSSYSAIPTWYFQSSLPERYSELKTSIPEYFYFRLQSRVFNPFSINQNSAESKTLGSGTNALTYNCDVNVRAMINVHSMPEEPYMRSMTDNVQSLGFQMTAFRPPVGFVQTASDTWTKVGEYLAQDEDFGAQLRRKLNGEDIIIAKTKTLKTDDEKISYLFNEVKNNMKWNGSDRWYTNDGTSKAWEKKSGNSTEINLILYHLLKQSGVKAYPMVVSTRSNGAVNPGFTNLRQFNRGVVYIPVDSLHMYVLDATDKYNSYCELPDELLGSSGFYIDKESKTYEILYLNQLKPVSQLVSVTAAIMADGHMDGTAQINSYSYNRINGIHRYKADGEQKYIDYLRNSDNTLKIASIKMENMEVDTLPLQQNISFKKELTSSDGSYIYFVPSVFVPLRNNPFVSEERFSDVDFGYRNNFSMTGNFKLPEGFKAETLPKNVTLEMPDKSITFRRLVIQDGGAVMVRYTVDLKKSVYYKENYNEFHEFYKKMSELINEPVALKKVSE